MNLQKIQDLLRTKSPNFRPGYRGKPIIILASAGYNAPFVLLIYYEPATTSASKPPWHNTLAASRIEEKGSPARSAISKRLWPPSDKFNTHNRAWISS